MPELMSPLVIEPGSRLELHGVPWNRYSTLLRVFSEMPGVRLTYDRGELEIMSPLYRHDFESRLLGKLVPVLAEAFGLPLIEAGSTTLRRKLKRRGLEPDESFWMQNAHRMAGKVTLNLNVDPPPDLVVEVEETHSNLDRLAIYAELGVPEIWWLKSKKPNLVFLSLTDDGDYRETKSSRSFPGIEPRLLLKYVRKVIEKGDQIAPLREFRKHLKRSRGESK
jgi:Uma2 family endonuclease